MKLIDAMIVYTRPDFALPDDPFAGQIAVVTHPDRTGVSRRFRFSTGACDADWKTCSEYERLALLFCAFQTAVIRDGIDPFAVHRAFLVIDEYRAFISPDCDGADPT